MDTEQRIQTQKKLVETIGQNYEQEGLQPVTGRIIALLMVMDKEEFTFDEIVEELEISKSSASVALKVLQASNIVEYITRPGDRKRYFRIKSQEPFQLFDEFKKKLIKKRELMKEILDLKKSPDLRNARFFNDLLNLTNFFLSKYDELKKEYFTNKNTIENNKTQ